jgi:hypothetical protein
MYVSELFSPDYIASFGNRILFILSRIGSNLSDLLMTFSGSSNYSPSRSLQESFLTRGGKPYSTVRDYDKKTFTEVFVDRDPRFAETFAYPGIYTEAANGQKEIRIPRPLRGGYCMGKYFMRRNTRETNAGASL